MPLVVLEPSCLAVFRDELLGLFPNDEDAKRLSRQALALSEFLTQKVKDYTPPTIDRRAIVHAHCHHRSVMGFGDEEALLKKMGLDAKMPEKGCCGMADLSALSRAITTTFRLRAASGHSCPPFATRTARR